MKKIFLIFSLTILFNNPYAESQEISGVSIGSGFSIIPSVNFVSSASVQLYPYSTDLFERSLTDELSGGYGYSLTLRKRFFREDLSFGLTAEYLKIVDDELTQTFENDTIRVRARVTEELVITPIEFTGYFNIPDFSEDLRIYLGGGVGAYFGDRKRKVHGIESQTISKKAGFSFLVLSGMELSFDPHLSGVFEVRFRQGEYSVSSKYPVSSINIGGTEFPLEQNLNSRIFVDGLKLSLGLAYNF